MSKSVLIVDDEKATAWALAESLRDDGLETEIAHSHVEALERCRSRHFDLVITDIRLPDRSGLELLGDLAERLSMPPAIVISAFGGPEVESAVGQVGAQAFFQKPFDVDALRDAVTSILAAPPTAV